MSTFLPPLASPAILPATLPASAPPLWQQLAATAQVVQGVMQGQSTTRLLPSVDAALRPGVQALAFDVLRRWGAAQALVRQLTRKPPPPPVRALLGTALALLCQPDPPYAAHTLVDQAVRAAKSHRATAAQAAFVNACLRRSLRDWAALQAAIADDAVARYHHPAWWLARLRQDHPEHWLAIVAASQHSAPLCLRANLAHLSVKNSPPALADIEKLASKIGAYAVPTWAGHQALVLRQPRPVERIAGFAEGRLSVQDAGAQMAAPLLVGDWPAGAPLRRVLDACAAPGGKTAHLLELLHGSGVQVTALDIDAARCERIRHNLQRLGFQADVRVADAAQPAAWWDGVPYDAILLDAPCTASGIVRRHPDVRWLRRESDVAALARQQRQLLDALWPLLRPGGRLLYCTCSVFKAEGAEQVAAFRQHNTGALMLPSPGHLLPTGPVAVGDVPDNRTRDEHDGFYYALLQKT